MLHRQPFLLQLDARRIDLQNVPNRLYKGFRAVTRAGEYEVRSWCYILYQDEFQLIVLLEAKLLCTIYCSWIQHCSNSWNLTIAGMHSIEFSDFELALTSMVAHFPWQTEHQHCFVKLEQINDFSLGDVHSTRTKGINSLHDYLDISAKQCKTHLCCRGLYYKLLLKRPKSLGSPKGAEFLLLSEMIKRKPYLLWRSL